MGCPNGPMAGLPDVLGLPVSGLGLLSGTTWANVPVNREGKPMANEADRTPWTIKAMPIAVRKRATDAANRQGQTVAEWMARAVNQLADMEDSAPRETPRQVAPPPPPLLDMVELRKLMEAAHATGQAAGVPVPKAIARHAFAVLAGGLRAARGLPAAPARKPRPLQIEHSEPNEH